jgi:hypothetical protein
MAYLQLPVQVLRILDLLVGLAIGHDEDRAQRLVADDHVPQRRIQRGDVEVSFERNHQRKVVGRARAFQLAQEPQPALRE